MIDVKPLQVIKAQMEKNSGDIEMSSCLITFNKPLYLTCKDTVWCFGSFRIQPLKTPYGLPDEQDMADTYINSKGELIVHRLLQPADPKAIES